MKEFFKVLGRPVKDRVTGFKGVATSLCFDLYGCVQVAVQPFANEAGDKAEDGHWYDFKRLEITGTPVMEVPTFTVKKEPGPADKPTQARLPVR